MTKLLTRLAAVAAVAVALPTAALAHKPAVTVTFPLPQVVIAPAPVPVVVARPPCPGPNYVWVDAGWRNDAYGRRIWVGGHWVHRPVTVVHRAPVRTVVVHR
jgi:hypothetical protein